jgi:predicted nucleic acid-binding protein
MKDKIFLDTNIIIYCYSSDNIRKKNIAQAIAQKTNTVISIQVLKEITNVLYKKFKIDWKHIEQTISELEKYFTIHTNTTDCLHLACQIADRYQYSYYDSLIISAALTTTIQINTDYTLKVIFNDGVSKIIDMKTHISKGSIAADLQNLDIFMQAKLYEYGRGIYWPNEYDLCPDSIYDS